MTLHIQCLSSALFVCYDVKLQPQFKCRATQQCSNHPLVYARRFALKQLKHTYFYIMDECSVLILRWSSSTRVPMNSVSSAVWKRHLGTRLHLDKEGAPALPFTHLHKQTRIPGRKSSNPASITNSKGNSKSSFLSILMQISVSFNLIVSLPYTDHISKSILL